MEKIQPSQPTEDQLIDYQLGILEPSEARQVEAYLMVNPQVKAQLDEVNHLTKMFEKMPLRSPSEGCLRAVEETALRYQKQPWFAGFLKSFQFKAMASWAAMALIVVGLGYTLNGLHGVSNTEGLGSKVSSGQISVPEMKASLKTEGQNSQEIYVPMSPPKESDEIKKQAANLLIQAQKAYDKHEYSQAAALLSRVKVLDASQVSNSKAKEIWIDSLKALGRDEDAKVLDRDLKTEF